MKLAIAHYAYSNTDTEVYLLETPEDFEEFMGVLEKLTQRTTQKMIKADVPLDHLGGSFRGIEKGLFQGALCRGSANELINNAGGVQLITNPIFLVGQMAQLYAENVLKSLRAGNKVILNKKGGYCVVCEEVSIKEIIGEVEYSFEQRISIREKTNYIVIENDVELEKPAKKYLKTKDSYYSYITELRLLNNEKLTELFKEFVSKGGTTLYIYTTGQDIQQARNYVQCALDAGIGKLEFQFSAIKPALFDEFMEEIKFQMGADVKEIVTGEE